MGLNSSDPLNVTSLLYRSHYTVNRYHFRFTAYGGDKHSVWVNLTQGHKYYMEAKHIDYGGSDHMAVGVEIQQSANQNHYHAMKEIQYLQAGVPNATFDTTRITVMNPNAGGFYQLVIMNPADMKYWTSDKIDVDASAG